MLTDTQRQVIRSILKEMTVRPKITVEQRAVIRQCCVEAADVAEPEKTLIAFKKELAAAANAENIPAGIEREALLSQIVTIYIDELYATRDDASLEKIHMRKETPASAPRLILDGDSGTAHL
jgi:hypothetical protein